MSTSIPSWWFVAAAILSAAAAYLRLSRLMATARQRRSVATGIGVAFLVSGGQAAVKHQGTPIALLIFADVMLGLLAMTVGMSEYFREAALVQSQGQVFTPTRGQKRRLLSQASGVVFALLALEFVFFVHSSSQRWQHGPR